MRTPLTESRLMLTRIVLDAIALVTACIGPWWVLVAVAAVLLLFLGAYEVVVAGTIADVLFAGAGTQVYGVEFLFTAGFLLFAVFSFVARKRLHFGTRLLRV